MHCTFVQIKNSILFFSEELCLFKEKKTKKRDQEPKSISYNYIILDVHLFEIWSNLFTKIPCSFYLKTCSLSTDDYAHTDVNKVNDRQFMIVFSSFRLRQISQKLKKSP